MSEFSRKLDGAAGSAGDSRALQQRFAHMFSGVPASVRKLVQGESSSKGVGIGGSTEHPYYVVVEDIEDTCCGNIGSSGKMCVRRRGECDIAKHSRDRSEAAKAGIFLRGATVDEVYLDPFASLESLPLDKKKLFLSFKQESFTSARDALINLRDSLVEKEKSIPMSEPAKDKTHPVDFNTPSAKRLKRIDLREKCEEILNASSEAVEKINSPQRKMIADFQSKRDVLLKLFADGIHLNQEDVETLFEKVLDLSVQLGVPPPTGPPGVWAGYLDLKADINAIQDLLNSKAPIGVESAVSILDNRLLRLDRSLLETKAETKEAIIALVTEFEASFGKQQQDTSTNNGPMETAATDDNPFDFVLDRVDKLTDLCNSLSKSDKPTTASVRIGRYCFASIDELRGWCEKSLPPEFPFGAFVDVYSFLQRIKSFRDKADPDSLKSMDYRNKLDLTADEAITLEAFSHPLPKGFRGTSSEEGQMAVWIPGIKTPEKWEDKNETVGVKIMIKENIEVVRSRVLAVIKHRLSGYPEAMALARELLADTITFITDLSEFMSSTLRTLRQAGFERMNAWNLVSKLVHRILGVDCYLKRGLSFELLDAKAHKSLAVSVLWGTFGTHQVLRGFQQHGIENHPSMSSEYVRFLVAHTDATKVDQLEKKMKDLETTSKKWETETKRLDKELDGAKRSITTANNKLEDLKKAVARLQSK